ncbi:nucleoside triphosphate pyrophosphohydrolase [Paenalkalicoccus suaedae]|uniref:Nucleoside triphosphate pyrophosphohydrolase n=1 Tax=Paenalkalicoccus suaedae TaxID=2592382 RepID=A0A859FC91_9BACI|nr:nucleoside triphosphate pyrophosphohydrolase [Paenalkalicoccus suaedae]QKS69846.1 nucleoside triphosphate pyrophosphohydrolase [Paenalkalicoccus suaedae]
MPIYNKLVRDGIPGIVEATGKRAVTRVLDEAEYEHALIEKLHEEVEELRGAGSDHDRIEEMADILELIHTYATRVGADLSEIEAVRKKKTEERGGFRERVFLISVED